MRRRLDAELVRRGLVASRSRAVEAVAAGRVTVSGAPATSPARLVRGAEAIALAGDPSPFVSRGGLKLAAALDEFAVAVPGCRALDAGASTGGFTDCLLQRGAAEVIAVDVGRGQLAWSLRRDARVHVLERTNIRALEPGAIGGPVPLATVDLSFVSLRLVAPALARLTTPAADLVVLVKPQFEAGRERVGKGGVVRDPAVHRDVLLAVVAGLGEAGLVARAGLVSPLRGADGNVEFVLHVRKAGSPLAVTQIDRMVGEAHGAAA